MVGIRGSMALSAITHAGGAFAAQGFSLFALAYLGYRREAPAWSSSSSWRHRCRSSPPLPRGGQREILALLVRGLAAAVVSYHVSAAITAALAGRTRLPDVSLAPVVEELMTPGRHLAGAGRGGGIRGERPPPLLAPVALSRASSQCSTSIRHTARRPRTGHSTGGSSCSRCRSGSAVRSSRS